MTQIVVVAGSNQGDKHEHLLAAKLLLSKQWDLVAQSRTYTSKATDYLDQPDFFNQAWQFSVAPCFTISKVVETLLEAEKKQGRTRAIDKGPRNIDLDLIFYEGQTSNNPKSTVPHPRCWERSFVILPTLELPCASLLKTFFDFPLTFPNKARPI